MQLPKRFTDDLPENLQSLPPADLLNITVLGPHPSSRILESSCNRYGLFRRYFGPSFPPHDPDSELTMDDHCDIPSSNSPLIDALDVSENVGQNYGPYPNRSSFLLGEWNWNDQVQKSKASFKSLIDIITDPNFHASDIRDTQWDAIDSQLGNSDIDVISFEQEPPWIKNDAGWTKTPITISVPFHRYTSNPGPRDYVVSEFYHRSIISILRQSLSHPLESLHFHYEPYELYWQRSKETDPIRVFGELYSSPAFLDAHRALQDSPPEPGCQLPRIVVGLMLASDATQLTSFGNARIWPQYLYFGNHSKYRRCRPNCHLCHHVAYFHKVSLISCLN